MKTAEDKTTRTIASTFRTKLENFFEAGMQLDHPFAIWRKPNEKTVHATLQLKDEVSKINQIETAPTGFTFSPFENSDDHQSEFIRSELMLDSDINEILLHPSFKNGGDKYEKFISTYQVLFGENSKSYCNYIRQSPKVPSSKEGFKTLVKKCQKHIAEGYYQKIVPSRQLNYTTKKSFHPIAELFKLCDAYEGAFVSLVYLPKCGLWIGATPELLLSVDENKTFKTISLAGTQAIQPNADLSQVAWMQKEIEEQAFVSRYIVNCFKKIRLREFDELGPKTVKAGNLIHLKTSFEVNMEEVNFPQLGSVMLDLLHPTSAVCGMPMLPAAKFLKANEGYDRAYYSGYLGPINYDGNTNIFVNLRCARIYKNGLILFAGAGVTEDSDPEKEWQETEIKFQTLLNVISK